MRSTATISPCGTYRYTLRRIWDDDLPPVYWVMLNPSTADANVDDPTIRRVIGFSRAWGYGSANVLNLFALRSTDPANLTGHADPVGPDNDVHLRSILETKQRHTIVAAWGSFKGAAGRARVIRTMMSGRLSCLGLTKDGHPRHPLYVRADQELVTYPYFGGGSIAVP